MEVRAHVVSELRAILEERHLEVSEIEVVSISRFSAGVGQWRVVFSVGGSVYLHGSRVADLQHIEQRCASPLALVKLHLDGRDLSSVLRKFEPATFVDAGVMDVRGYAEALWAHEYAEALYRGACEVLESAIEDSIRGCPEWASSAVKRVSVMRDGGERIVSVKVHCLVVARHSGRSIGRTLVVAPLPHGGDWAVHVVDHVVDGVADMLHERDLQEALDDLL